MSCGNEISDGSFTLTVRYVIPRRIANIKMSPKISRCILGLINVWDVVCLFFGQVRAKRGSADNYR